MKFPKILNRTDHRQRKMRHLSVIKMNQLNQFGRFSKKISAQNLLIHDIPSAFFPSSISIMIRLKRAEVANTLPLNLQDNKRACEEKKKQNDLIPNGNTAPEKCFIFARVLMASSFRRFHHRHGQRVDSICPQEGNFNSNLAGGEVRLKGTKGGKIFAPGGRWAVLGACANQNVVHAER